MKSGAAPQASNALAQLLPQRRIPDYEGLRLFLSFRHNIFVSETLLPTVRWGTSLQVEQSEEGTIMAKLKRKAAAVTKASKGIGASNAKALAFWGACWMIGFAVPSPCGRR